MGQIFQRQELTPILTTEPLGRPGRTASLGALGPQMLGHTNESPTAEVTNLLQIKGKGIY